MKIYLDSCCYGRPYDRQTDAIYAESEAIQNIIKLALWYGYKIFGSATLEAEIDQISSPEKHGDVFAFYTRSITDRAYLKKGVFEHVSPMALRAGVRGLDVFHLCIAISALADYLLTTDKGFLKAVARLDLPIKVINPLQFPLGGMV